jgi:hypothetical protein
MIDRPPQVNDIVRPSGLVIPGPEGEQCGFFQPPWGAAQITVETPPEILARMEEYEAQGKRRIPLHEVSFGGHPIFASIEMLDQCILGWTFKTKGRVTPGTIFAGSCPCEICDAKRNS